MHVRRALKWGVVGGMLLWVVSCTQITGYVSSDCSSSFVLVQNESVNKQINNLQSAYLVLKNQEPGWRKDSVEYQDFKGSTQDDLVFKKIIVILPQAKRNLTWAYVLKDQMAVDIQGNVYKKSMC